MRIALAVILVALGACGPTQSREEDRAERIATEGSWKKGWKPSLPTEESDMVKGARKFARDALGAEPGHLVEKQGIREKAVCGVAGSRRFVYREKRPPIVEGEWTGPIFESAIEGWCPPGWPA